jgi:hypothetical protein
MKKPAIMQRITEAACTADTRAQVAPRRAGTDQPQHGVNELTIVRAVPTFVLAACRT